MIYYFIFCVTLSAFGTKASVMFYCLYFMEQFEKNCVGSSLHVWENSAVITSGPGHFQLTDYFYHCFNHVACFKSV